MFLDTVEKTIEIMYAQQGFSIVDVANMCNVSSAYAGRKFKEEFGKSFNSYLTEYRLNKAMQMLRETNEKVIEISKKCGFGSSTYFVTTFKKYVNITPQEYRKNCSKQ